MPHQVSFSHRKRVFNEVRLISAGQDQYNLCGSRVYLLAEVEGMLAGHTVEWEQNSGTGVTLFNQFNINPYYDEVDSSDKVFTIYIDRGTPYEQSASTKVFGTPTSLASGSCESTGFSVQKNDILDMLPVACDDIEAFVNISVDPPTSTHGVETGVNIDIELTWDHPGDAVKDLHIEQYRVVENGVDVGFYPPTPLPLAGEILGAGEGPPSMTLFYLGILANYRIDTYYNISGMKYVRESCVKDFTNLTIPSVDAYNDAIDGTTFANNTENTTFNRINYITVTLQYEDTPTPTFRNETENTNFSRTNFTTETLTYEGAAVTSFGSSDSFINITRLGGIGIGGGP